ncbi:hypothetical protein EDD85DRAFT_952230 [Armillaria nabsnona]|nr:hypothetical protein EDD85DRAFT_952230 [Armillaria nabsnona]
MSLTRVDVDYRDQLGELTIQCLLDLRHEKIAQDFPFDLSALRRDSSSICFKAAGWSFNYYKAREIFVKAILSSNMKGLFVSCIAVFLSLGVVSANENATACPKNTAIPLLRAYLGEPYYDHFYTTDAAEMQHAVTALPYRQEGSPGLVFGFQAPGTVPFYRTYHPTVYDHFYTTNLSERDRAINVLGYSNEGIVGYIYPKEMCCSVPLYRLYHDKPVWDHFLHPGSKGGCQCTGSWI